MNRGYTLAELVTVLALAGILAAVAVPRMVNQDVFYVRGAAAEVRAALRYAQRVAMAKGREVCVSLAPTSVALHLNPSTMSGAACTFPVSRPGLGGAYIVNLPSGLSLVPALGFRFDAQGRPVPNIDVNLTVGGSVPIVVARETGRVQ